VWQLDRRQVHLMDQLPVPSSNFDKRLCLSPRQEFPASFRNVPRFGLLVPPPAGFKSLCPSEVSRGRTYISLGGLDIREIELRYIRSVIFAKDSERRNRVLATLAPCDTLRCCRQPVAESLDIADAQTFRESHVLVMPWIEVAHLRGTWA
jgi:hypothetical protein